MVLEKIKTRFSRPSKETLSVVAITNDSLDINVDPLANFFAELLTLSREEDGLYEPGEEPWNKEMPELTDNAELFALNDSEEDKDVEERSVPNVTDIPTDANHLLISDTHMARLEVSDKFKPWIWVVNQRGGRKKYYYRVPINELHLLAKDEESLVELLHNIGGQLETNSLLQDMVIATLFLEEVPPAIVKYTAQFELIIADYENQYGESYFQNSEYIRDHNEILNECLSEIERSLKKSEAWFIKIDGNVSLLNDQSQAVSQVIDSFSIDSLNNEDASFKIAKIKEALPYIQRNVGAVMGFIAIKAQIDELIKDFGQHFHPTFSQYYLEEINSLLTSAQCYCSFLENTRTIIVTDTFV